MSMRFHSYSADEFLAEFVAPEDRARVLEAAARHAFVRDQAREDDREQGGFTTDSP